MTLKKNVLVFGATGTAGQGAVRALLAAGHHVSCVVRKPQSLDETLSGVEEINGDITVQGGNLSDALQTRQFDVVLSCLASRTGAPKDAWAIDYKLAFEAELIASGLTYSIVRPTAFFKSLSGQIERVKNGKGFLVFGDGTLTACTPLSDDDLGRFITSCIEDTAKHNKVLPIGGPGPAITPNAQGDALARLLGKPVKIKRVPVALLDCFALADCSAVNWLRKQSSRRSGAIMRLKRCWYGIPKLAHMIAISRLPQEQKRYSNTMNSS